MTMLRRDILITLILKFTLLIALWFVCFKNVEKKPIHSEQWLLGKSSASLSVYMDDPKNIA